MPTNTRRFADSMQAGCVTAKPKLSWKTMPATRVFRTSEPIHSGDEKIPETHARIEDPIRWRSWSESHPGSVRDNRVGHFRGVTGLLCRGAQRTNDIVLGCGMVGCRNDHDGGIWRCRAAFDPRKNHRNPCHAFGHFSHFAIDSDNLINVCYSTNPGEPGFAAN